MGLPAINAINHREFPLPLYSNSKVATKRRYGYRPYSVGWRASHLFRLWACHCAQSNIGRRKMSGRW